MTTKVPPAYDGRSSWFAYEDAIDDWVDITELEPEKQGPALRNRLEGEAAIHKRLLDRDKLKDKVNGVKYFKSYLRPLYVKGASNVFLYRFQQFMTLHRGSGDKNPDCGLWYRLDQTTSQFTFANSESASCKQKIVVCMYDVDYAVQSTEFDIVEQGEVPTLTSLPQMRNLRFQFDLHPDKAYLSSPVLGIKNMNLKVARSTHLILDLLDVCEFMWNVKFEKHKKVSFFTDHKHFEFGYNQNEEVFALDDEWIMNEPEMELIRLHKRERHQTFVPSSTPIPPEFLDSKRKTILEFKNGKKEVKEDDWKASVKAKQFHSPQAWRGKTIFKILPGGIENRTLVKVRLVQREEESQMMNLSRRERENPGKSSGNSPLGEVPIHGFLSLLSWYFAVSLWSKDSLAKQCRDYCQVVQTCLGSHG